VAAAQYLHPEFRFVSPKERFRRRLWLALASLAAVGVGAAMTAPSSASKSDAAIDQVLRLETIPGVSPVGYDPVDAQRATTSRSPVIVQKPTCLDPGQSDGSCLPSPHLETNVFILSPRIAPE
jgi:hypothetical protein